jgi:hypothetical protein
LEVLLLEDEPDELELLESDFVDGVEEEGVEGADSEEDGDFAASEPEEPERESVR